MMASMNFLDGGNDRIPCPKCLVSILYSLALQDRAACITIESQAYRYYSKNDLPAEDNRSKSFLKGGCWKNKDGTEVDPQRFYWEAGRLLTKAQMDTTRLEIYTNPDCRPVLVGGSVCDVPNCFWAIEDAQSAPPEFFEEVAIHRSGQPPLSNLDDRTQTQPMGPPQPDMIDSLLTQPLSPPRARRLVRSSNVVNPFGYIGPYELGGRMTVWADYYDLASDRQPGL